LVSPQWDAAEVVHRLVATRECAIDMNLITLHAARLAQRRKPLIFEAWQPGRAVQAHDHLSIPHLLGKMSRVPLHQRLPLLAAGRLSPFEPIELAVDRSADAEHAKRADACAQLHELRHVAVDADVSVYIHRGRTGQASRASQLVLACL